MSNLSGAAILAKLDERCEDLQREIVHAAQLNVYAGQPSLTAKLLQAKLDEAQSIRSLIESMVGVTPR